MQPLKEIPNARRDAALTELAIRELEGRHSDKREGFLEYVKYMFSEEKGELWMDNWHYHEMEEALVAMVNGEINRAIFNVPPGSAKTELITKMFPVWCLGNSPKEKFIATGYSASMTQYFSSQAKDYYKSETNRSVFPRLPSIRDDQDRKEHWENEVGGGYYATGVGGAITGFRSNYFLIDDPLKADEAFSSNQLDKINRWMDNTVYSRLFNQSKDKIIVIMQRLHDKDLCGYLMKNDEILAKLGKPIVWQKFIYPAIALKDEEHRKQGEALQIERFPIQDLMKLKASMRESFSPQFQQDPIDFSLSDFKREWIIRYDKLPARLKIRVIVDLASSEDKRSDENAILVIGEAQDHRRYVLVSWGDWGDESRRFDPGEVIEKIYSLADEYVSIDPTISIHVESVSYQKTMTYWLKQHAANRRHEGEKIYRLEEIKTPTTRSKDDKIKALIPFFSNDMIRFPVSGTSELEKQMLRFPRGERVDRLDTLAMDLDLEKKPRPYGFSTPTPKYDKGRIIKFK